MTDKPLLAAGLGVAARDVGVERPDRRRFAVADEPSAPAVVSSPEKR